jgi:hypothetical protein
MDVWFPDHIQESIDSMLTGGEMPGPSAFPAEWAAVRQFELLQEAGNHKIYDLSPEHLARALREFTGHMHGGGYTVTVATIGSYCIAGFGDELEVLDRRLQSRISHLINMLYLEEQSEQLNAGLAETLRREKWDYQMALPHIGATLGAHDLFRPSFVESGTRCDESHIIRPPLYQIKATHAACWTDDLGVTDVATGKIFACVTSTPAAGQYGVETGVYRFAAANAGREMSISYRYGSMAGERGRRKISEAGRKHRRARHFFEILSLLPQKHILHETAIGLQLPESINENQWIYIAPDGEKVGDFVRLLDNLFVPFGKSTVSHMRGYGDRLNPDSIRFHRHLARYTRH